MQNTSRGTFRILLIALLLIAVIAGVMAYRALKRGRAVETAPAAVASTTKPLSTAPATVPHAAEPPRDRALLDVVRAAYPDFAETQPLSAPLELSQAAHLRLHDPIYLGGLGRTEMWITRADAPPIETVLKQAVDEAIDPDAHVLRERVVFVHWMPIDNAVWPPYVVCRTSAGGYEVISAAHGHQPLPVRDDVHWDDAMSWNDRVIVPTAHGISIIHFGREITENHHELIPPGPTTQPAGSFARPRFLLDAEGLLAWLPWEAGRIGGVGATHYFEPPADESTGIKPKPTWTDLTPDNGWPAKLLHLVPLLDGTVLMLVVDETGAVQLQFNTLVHTAVKEEEIVKLVNDLSDSDQVVRTAAYDKLSQYGSGIWPILEKLSPDQGPEAQARMRQLLKAKVVPTLNGMALLGDKKLMLAARLSDGGTVFYAEAGVSIPNLDDPDSGPGSEVPAWISIRPGRPIELLPAVMTADLTPGQSQLYVSGNNWIVTNDIRGPRRFVGNGFVNLLRKSEHEFSDFAGMDRRGRWLFRRPHPATPATAPATESATTTAADLDETLVIDPTLPDPNPRLPVWVLNNADEAGWTKAGWPVTKKNSAYALHELGWQLLKDDEPMLGKAEDVPPQVEPEPPSATATSNPATIPATSATTQSAVGSTSEPNSKPAGDEPILTDRNGTRYFGGLTNLRITPRQGPAIDWPLPAVAGGEGPAWLVRTKDGRLYLFNQPGRVIRLKPTPGQAEPFKLEKVFTHNVPTAHHPMRIWLDPAGRIAMTWENQLAVFFPDGYFPPPIADLMLQSGVDEMDE